MTLNHLSNKQQVIILVSVMLLLLGAYTHFRLINAVDSVGELSKQLKTDRKLLKNPDIPEEPIEDISDLEAEVEELDTEINQLTTQASTLGKKLPNTDKQQDVMLKISEAARASRVRIVNNVPYLTRKRIELAVDTNTGKKLSRKERKKKEARLRKAIKKARKQAANAGIGVFTREGELMDKLVNDFEVSRPLHELKIEGTYHNIKTFIEALQGLPWQITVVKIDYTLLGQNTAQGYPQPLIVNMIIGA